MRVAALYDVHGNLPALEAVLAEPDVTAADRIVLGGDLLAGPWPSETLARLRALGERAVWIRGNADRELGPEGVSADAPPVLHDIAAYAAGVLGKGDRAFLAGLPLAAVLDVDGLGPVRFCHATPRSDTELVTSLTADAVVAEILDGVAERTVVAGHTHAQYDRAVGPWRLVNAGSVGMPYEGRRGAFWTLLGGADPVAHRRTEYDAEAAVAAIRTGYPDADGLATLLLTPYTREEVERVFEERAGR